MKICGCQTSSQCMQMLSMVTKKASCFPAGCADAAAEDGRRGSNVYEVNPWLWQFGRGKPRIGGLTIKETEEKKEDARKSSDKRRKETRAGRKGDRASK